ncbi:putative serine threonine protein kinase protein [Botrytis fragariae]|uniref:Putative serine threonine protein kinase protein n=1 Tax=Botrytis fragariae TaxID=1964551 RepID=A0A8H6AJ38_9HELO|nr:putative serine threonine protein kinase protein [Botrytis fragariae]KAF5868236.1 putative serine threonine protein kinase protein [Botrytis fragariae]
MTLASMAVVKRFRRRSPGVLNISKGICVKFGTFGTLVEASAMKFIGEHTSIPVPKIYCSFVHKGMTYIVMERIRGKQIACGWALRKPESQAKILSQIREMVAEMRKLTSKTSRIANIDGAKLYDGRLDGSEQFGPFKNTNEFHRYLRSDLPARPNNPEGLNELIEWQDRPLLYLPVFTHGDLSSFNILAVDDKVVGIIDWETAGWYPFYWEYTTAMYVNPQNMFWKKEIDKFLDPFPTAQAMEEIRQKYFGDY